MQGTRFSLISISDTWIFLNSATLSTVEAQKKKPLLFSLYNVYGNIYKYNFTFIFLFVAAEADEMREETVLKRGKLVIKILL